MASIATGKGDDVHAGYTLLFRQVLKGDATALDAIGSFLTYGVGVGRDLTLAAACYEAAAPSHSGALYNWASALIEGAGVRKDVARGLRLMRLAHRRGEIAATNYLGYCYRVGLGVSRRPVKGFQMTAQAAEGGCVAAQFDVGVCYVTGDGVAQDQRTGLMWIRRAAQGGDAQAQDYLASLDSSPLKKQQVRRVRRKR